MTFNVSLFIKDIRTEKMISIAVIMKKYNYVINDATNKRINNYNFQANTTITHSDKHKKISTETNISGVHNILFLFFNGMSKLGFEFY